ncbi:DUF5011 domain-containing protein [Bacillus sp. RG28]|uniref:DUF5011 domain-containing protein n=1 Tax=Gottfriedia endophytica TaxID=2820819 RepID=A0A940SLN1_9BACI|nr:immunoglobulin-like domain-containing protein [Gottfriedia endophytica]MBP0726468.1 DUF5011 domain-containing protein [Gottfriedia endophytica]
MKKTLLGVGVITCFTFGFFTNYSSAESNLSSDLSSKCTSYGEIKNNQNPSFQQINCLLTNAAINADIPPEVVKSVAYQESGWDQFKVNGIGDNGIGIMQITNHPEFDQQKLKDDISYNIESGVQILNQMYDRTDLPKIKDADRHVIENWYFPVMAYNGTKPENSPIYQDTGNKNEKAYQEKVFRWIENDSFQYNETTHLGQFSFTINDFNYDKNSNKNIEFLKKEYIVPDQHSSVYFFKTGDKVVATQDINLRSKPSTSKNQDGTTNIIDKITKNTTLIINGEITFDQSKDSKNQFVWIPVKTADQKLEGYVSSSYITKNKDSLEKPMIIGAIDKTIKVGEAFDPFNGVTANDNIDGDLTSKILVTGTVDKNRPNSYSLVYSVANSSGLTTTVTRNIKVIDDIKPIIFGVKNKSININSAFDPKKGVTAIDNVDGDLTKNINISSQVNTKVKRTYQVKYTVTDSSGNTTLAYCNIKVVDNIPPKIFGATTQTIKLNQAFNNKKGVTAYDNVDGNLTSFIKVSGNVNTKKRGTYSLTYIVTDKSGNQAIVKRIIIVK